MNKNRPDIVGTVFLLLVFSYFCEEIYFRNNEKNILYVLFGSGAFL